MDVERALVTRIAKTQSMDAPLSRTIEPYHFMQRKKGDTSKAPLPGEVYAWMKDHLSRHKAVPSFDLTRQVWPLFEFYDTGDAAAVLTEQMVKVVKRRILIEGIRQAAEVVDDVNRIGDAELHLYAIAAELARAVPSSNVTRLSDSGQRLEKHKVDQVAGLGSGISLVLADLDAVTGGLQSYELMIWEGFLNIGKSSIAMAQAARAYSIQNATALVFSLEMEGDKLAQRWDSMMGKIKYDAIKKMELTEDDYDKWARFAEHVHEARFDKDVIVIDDIHHPTPERIFAEIEKWKPDFSIVDTIDELRAPSNLRQVWEQQAYAARELKGICRATKRPIVGVAQAGRNAEEDGATLGNIAGSIDIARKADIVIGLHANASMQSVKQMEVRALKFRDSGKKGSKWTYYWDIGNMEFRPWTPNDNVSPPPRPAGPPNQAPPGGPMGAPEGNGAGTPAFASPGG